MNEFIHGVVRAAAETFDFPQPILEVGAFIVAGQESIANLRGLFPGKQYVGIDMRPGPGVDSVENVEGLPRGDATVGSVLALNVFEHVERFWRGFDEIHRVLRPDGLVLVSCPFYFHIHAHPNDYWRFTPEALHALLRKFPTRIIGWHGLRKRPLNVWALAAGPLFPTITESAHARFRDLIRSHARQPLGWAKALRYRIGRVFCGRGPFAPFLDAEQFDTELVRSPGSAVA